MLENRHTVNAHGWQLGLRMGGNGGSVPSAYTGVIHSPAHPTSTKSSPAARIRAAGRPPGC